MMFLVKRKLDGAYLYANKTFVFTVTSARKFCSEDEACKHIAQWFNPNDVTVVQA